MPHVLKVPSKPIAWEHVLDITLPSGQVHTTCFWVKIDRDVHGVNCTYVEDESIRSGGPEDNTMSEFSDDDFCEVQEYLETLTFNPDTGSIS